MDRGSPLAYLGREDVGRMGEGDRKEKELFELSAGLCTASIDYLGFP